MTNQQIIELYEASEGLSIDEIASELQLDSRAIKLILASGSSVYRAKLASQTEEFSKDDRDAAKEVLKHLMYNAENETVKLRAATRIYDESLNRNDVKGLKNLNVNVNLINMQIKQAEEAIKKAKTKTIDIDERHKHLAEIAT
jgi:hypothetical protein